MNFVALRLCVTKTLMIFLFSFIFVSCSPYKRLAYDFVNKSKGASVAFYVPDDLQKTNLRDDCDIESDEFAEMDENQIIDIVNSRIKILNEIDDEIFLDVMIASFEETLNDYDLNLQYWEDGDSKPDSLHWVVDLSHMEIQEVLTHQYVSCGMDGNYELIPLTRINVASWFEVLNDEKSMMVFTEHNYDDYIADCYYTMDSVNNVVANVEFQSVDINGFYSFAVALGKLYAGYIYDFFMNEYVSKEMMKNGKEYSVDDNYMRYDPYEMYIYYTVGDRAIIIEN